MPNKVGAPTQSNALQVGDICYDDTTELYYFCSDASLGAAVWLPWGGASTPGPDHQAARIIVGNALTGDTLTVCNILDTGDGAGIQTALTAAGLLSPPGDVYVRPGVYTLASPLTIPEGVRLLGAGRGRTRIEGFVDTPSIEMAARGSELCDVDILATSTFGVDGTGGIVQIRFQGTTTQPPDPFAVRRMDIRVNSSYAASVNVPLSGIAIVGSQADFILDGNAIEDVTVSAVDQFSALSGTNIAERFAAIRAALTLAPSEQPVRVDITNVHAFKLEANTILEGVSGKHRTCQYEGLGMGAWSPLPGQQVGFYASTSQDQSTYDACEARIDITTSIGFRYVGLDDNSTRPVAINSCATYYDPALLGAGGVGFSLETPNMNDILVAMRMYCNFVETAAVGYFCDTNVSNTVAIGNGTISVSTDVDDLGSFNDFGHLQAN